MKPLPLLLIPLILSAHIESFAVYYGSDRIEELKRLGITQLIVGSPIGKDKAKAIKLIGREIIQRFRLS